MTNKLSAVIITLNEEKNIGCCLQSLQGLADEIVVVDSFSDDRTEEICKTFGVRFIQQPFKGYATQKNFAMQVASNDIILNIDADEVLSPELRNSIIAVKNNWDADGYFFNRLTNYCGTWIRHCGWYPDRKLRLVDRRKAQWGGGEVHEKIIMVQGATTKFLKGDLLHYSYSTVNEYVQQQRHFADLAAKDSLKKGQRSSIFHVVINPLYTFIRKYFLQLGFLDGRNGWIISYTSAKANYWKYSRLRKLQG